MVMSFFSEFLVAFISTVMSSCHPALGLGQDVSRHKADAIANASKAIVLNEATGKWKVKERWEVAVGDFVKVLSR